MKINLILIFGVLGAILLDQLSLPFGAIIGFFLGSVLGLYVYVQYKKIEQEKDKDEDYKKRKGAYSFHVFMLCAKMAKCDGKVNEKEVQFMEGLMRNKFRFTQRGRSQAIKVWKAAKDSTEPFEQFARSFFNDFRKDRFYVQEMMDMLFAVAACDGNLHPREEILLRNAAGIFQISGMQYERIKSRYYHTQSTAQQQRWTPLDPHYAILGAKPADTLDMIKKKYRALAIQWHPDKMAAKGASPEALRHAKEKFQQINEAYEKILQAKN